MNAPLDDLYLEWLYSQVASVKTRARTKTYWSLLRQLFRKEFVWSVPNDDNRVEDGRDLRLDFIRECNIEHVPDDWMRLGCSMLELLIGLAKRFSFEADREPQDCFWEMLENVGLEQCTDARYGEAMDSWVDEILNRIIDRNYNPDGVGGLFPLRYSSQDQREVELWYQLCAYLLEDN